MLLACREAYQDRGGNHDLLWRPERCTAPADVWLCGGACRLCQSLELCSSPIKTQWPRYLSVDPHLQCMLTLRWRNPSNEEVAPAHCRQSQGSVMQAAQSLSVLSDKPRPAVCSICMQACSAMPSSACFACAAQWLCQYLETVSRSQYNLRVCRQRRLFRSRLRGVARRGRGQEEEAEFGFRLTEEEPIPENLLEYVETLTEVTLSAHLPMTLQHLCTAKLLARIEVSCHGTVCIVLSVPLFPRAFRHGEQNLHRGCCCAPNHVQDLFIESARALFGTWSSIPSQQF